MFTITQEMMSYQTAVDIITKHRYPKGMCEVAFTDKTVKVPIRAAILQLPIWEIYRTLHQPVTSKRLFFTKGPYSPDVIDDIFQTIYDDLFMLGDSEDDVFVDSIRQSFWNAINRIDAFGTMELNEEHATLSIVGLAKLVHHPIVREILDTPMPPELGTVRGKEIWKETNDNLIKVLSTDKLIPDNQLYHYLNTGSLKKGQVGQVMYSYGYRTEVNDKVIPRPVYGSSLEGLLDICDYAIENQAARKNVYFNKDGIRNSQYFGRKMGLLVSIVAKVYGKVCNSDVTLPWEFTESNILHCIGKLFIDPDTREVTPLIKYNYEKYIGKTVQMFSPITCGHRNGLCRRCIGLLAKNYARDLNIGFLCASEFVSKMSQRILSTKHIDQTTPMAYEIPYPANELITHSNKGIMFTKRAEHVLLEEHKDAYMGFNLNDFRATMSDLYYIDDAIDVPSTPEDKYTSIKHLYIKKTPTSDPTVFTLQVGDKIPFLTRQGLAYIKQYHKYCKLEGNILWVPLRYMHKDFPFMRSIVYNSSMLTFVEQVCNMVEKDVIAKYTNASFALRDFSDMIFEKIPEMNIFPLETILKAHLVTSPSNYSIPIVTDPTKVMFRQTEKIISGRTISGQLAFESHNKHFSMPETYLYLHEQNSMDQFFGH